MGKIGAPYGNKNAEKWSFRKAIQLYKDAIKLSREIETFVIKINDKGKEVTGYKYDFIGEISGELGTYHQLITRDLPKRFPTLKRLSNELISNLERNCYSNTKKGIIKEATGIVNLKSNHKWTDRIHAENEHKLVDEFDSKSDDELKKYIEDGNINIT